MVHIRNVTREEFVRTTMRKMAPPLGIFSHHYLSIEQSLIFTPIPFA